MLITTGHMGSQKVSPKETFRNYCSRVVKDQMQFLMPNQQ